ncbi:apyrase [Ranunculus cassubicifolius]
MGFTRIADVISSAITRKPSTNQILPDSIPLEGGSSHVLVHPEHKNYLRFSSSAQDFSTYNGFEKEKDIDGSARHAMLPRSLENENGSSSFSKERMSPRNSVIWKKWVRTVVCVICFVLSVALICFGLIYYGNHLSREASRYYVVLDCGSTGTRVYVYESSVEHKNDGSLPFVLRSLPKESQGTSQGGRAYQRMETEPSLDKLVHNVSGLRGALRPLLQWAEEKIPEKAHKDTSLFLYATAGVRRLPDPHSKWLLKNAWLILQNSSFVCRREWVKTITGMEEAYYGWVALNYQMGMLGSIPAKETFGALDLGGSSLQVTFETKKPLQDETSLNLSIGAVNHHLTAYSLSGYGLNDAFDKSVVQLLKKLPGITRENLNNGKLEVKHPCLQTGYKEKYMCSHCASLNQEVGSPLLGEGNRSKGAKAGIAVELIGAPQWKECSALAKITVNLSEWSTSDPGIDCAMQPCALKASLPQPRGQFFAISGFFVVFRFFNLSSEATLDDVLQKGQEFCEKTWQIAKNSVPPQPFIEQYCLRAPYIVSLLREGLHITDRQVVVGSGRITWTLGVALLEAGGALSTGMDIHSYSILHMKMNRTFIFVMAFMSVMFLICALTRVGNGMRRAFRRSYLPLFKSNNTTTSSVLNITSPFKFQRWSPINSGDARMKMPLSPTIAGSQDRPFSMGHGLGGSSVQLMEYSLRPSSGSVSHSYSSGTLGQTHIESSSWNPNRSQMRLQSRRSQSREDLNSSVAEAHLGIV